MKKILLLLAGGAAAILVSAVAAVYGLSQRKLTRRIELPPVSLDGVKADAALGKRLVDVRLGCAICHGSDLSGAAVVNDPAFAVVSGVNITSGKLKDWSDGEIARAIRHGVARDGRPLVLMPSHDFQHLSREDLASVVAYLRTVPTVDPEPARPKVGPVARALNLAGKLPTLLAADVVDHSRAFPAAVRPGVTVEFGAYLVKTSCEGCHGPELRGGPIPGGDPSWPFAASLRPEALDGWDEAAFVRAMREGVNPSKSKLRDPMPIALTRQFDDVELKALWTYLQSLPKSDSF